MIMLGTYFFKIPSEPLSGQVPWQREVRQFAKRLKGAQIKGYTYNLNLNQGCIAWSSQCVV